MKLTGKAALISGAGGGIGRAIALAFAEAGAAVACVRYRCRRRRRKPRGWYRKAGGARDLAALRVSSRRKPKRAATEAAHDAFGPARHPGQRRRSS